MTPVRRPRPSIARRLLPLILGLALVGAACADGTRAGPVPGPSASPSPVFEGEVFFAPGINANSQLDAGTAGYIRVENGCVLLENGGQLTFPVWQWDYTFGDDAVRGPKGEPIARVGEWVQGGGGSLGLHWDFIAETIGEEVPERCRNQVIGASQIWGVEPSPPPPSS